MNKILSTKTIIALIAFSTVLFLVLNLQIQTVLDSHSNAASIPIYDDKSKVNNNINNNIINQSIIKTTKNVSFKHLFNTIPHKCIMEKDCHLHLSDSPQFMNKTIIIIGMVRDSEKDVIATLQQLDEISCLFNKIVFIFYESNSKDNTPHILKDWSEMFLNGDHCKYFRYNLQTNASNTSIYIIYIYIYIYINNIYHA